MLITLIKGYITLGGNLYMDTLGLSLEWFVNVDHLPFFAGLYQGFFKDEGIDLHIVEPVNHEAGMKLVSTGKLDIAITEPVHMPEAVANGLRIKAFAKYFITGFGIITKSNIKDFSQFRGIRVATPLDKYTKIIIREMAKYKGIEIDPNEIEVIPASYYLVDALLSNKAEAAFAAFENYEVVEAKYKGLDVNFFRFTDYGVPSYGYLVLVARTETLRKKRDLIRGFLDALRRSIRFTLEYPDKAFNALITYVPILDNELNRIIMRETLKCFTDNFSLSKEEWEKLANFYYKHWNKRIDASDMIESFV